MYSQVSRCMLFFQVSRGRGLLKMERNDYSYTQTVSWKISKSLAPAMGHIGRSTQQVPR